MTALVIEAIRNTEFERHWLGLICRSPSKSAFVKNTAIVGGKRNNAGNETRFDRFPEDVIDNLLAELALSTPSLRRGGLAASHRAFLLLQKIGKPREHLAGAKPFGELVASSEA